MPTMMKEGFGNIFTKVPVVIVGSHYDLISPESREEDISRMQSLVNEMTVKLVQTRVNTLLEQAEPHLVDGNFCA